MVVAASRITKGEPMSVAKIIELVASSDKSWDDAVRAAVAEAAKTVRGIRAGSTSRTGPRA
jgi:flavin-binding protein dodecin